MSIQLKRLVMSNIIVLIPHYNNLIGLKKTIASINEDISVDILVIDDGSTNKLDKSDIKYNGKVF